MMEKAKAADLSTRMAEAHVAELDDEEIGDELYKGVDEAIFSFAFLLPENATTAIVRDGETPILAALSGAQLYLMTAVDGKHNSREVAINCEAHHIRPGHDRVEMKIRFKGISGPAAIREVEWNFTIGQSSLMIQTHVHPDHGVSDAEALSSPPSERPYPHLLPRRGGRWLRGTATRRGKRLACCRPGSGWLRARCSTRTAAFSTSVGYAS